MERLKLKSTIERLPVFGLGCAGGVIGLARTAQLCAGAPQKCGTNTIHYIKLAHEDCFTHADRRNHDAEARTSSTEDVSRIALCNVR